MSLPIRTQAFVVEVSASIMPPLTEAEIHNAVLRIAVEKQSAYGLGYLAVNVHEGFNERTEACR